jgi:hypothetical protein
MGKASSAKKIRRVQQAGVSRSPGQRRNLAFPALIVGIIVAGTVLTLLARESRQADASVAPVANRDHWHAAFGIDICGETQPAPGDVGPDRLGIHTHADGLIHIHPFGDGGAGENATFGKFADQVGIQLGDGSFTLADGTTYTTGDACPGEGGETGRVALYVWPPQANENTEPRIVTRNLAEVRFTEDDQIFVLAFVPEDAEVSIPASVEALANPSDEEPQPGSVNGTVPSTSAGGDTTTTAPGDGGSTTAPASDGDGATPTTEPAG